MDSHRVSTVDVPESPIASGVRGPWQQRCDSLHCHEECWGSVPPSVFVFAWVHAITISSPNWKNHYDGPGTMHVMNLSMLKGRQYGTSTKMDALIVYDAFQTFAKSDIMWGWLYWRYINVVALWIKPCQKYRTVAITFYPTLVNYGYFVSLGDRSSSILLILNHHIVAKQHWRSA